jgi:Fe(3+) dicitrate transport protein
MTTQQTGGSYGLINSFNSISGGTRRLSYYGFVHLRSETGARPNSDYSQATEYSNATLRLTDKLSFGAEFTRSRNRIHMPGGLSDAQFTADATQSLRSRNWLASPWNVSVLRASYDVNRGTQVETTLSYVDSDRHLIWRNEDGGPDAADDLTQPREAEAETFRNWTLETRLRADHQVFGRRATLASGIRAGYNRLGRLEGGPGATGTAFDMGLYGGTWERALRFKTTNVALFAEELVHLGTRFSVTGGARLEHLRSSAAGYTDIATTFVPRSYRFPLFGFGAELLTSATTQLYANVSESYRPVLYASLTPLGSITRVDSALKSSWGRTSEFGWRGNIAGSLKFDIGGFYIWYADRLGVRADSTGSHTISGNIGNSVHRGAEAYVEVDPVSNLDVFASLAYVDARYVSGEFAGNRVELAPRGLIRAGITYAWRVLSSTAQLSYTGDSFGDASNAYLPTDDAVAGFIPSYSVADWTGVLALNARRALTFGVNNVTNVRYFTKRTGEYPGPGILPGAPRSAYAGLKLRF